MSDNRYYVKHIVAPCKTRPSVYSSKDKMKNQKAKPVAKRQPRPIGLGKGDFVVPDDFDDPLPKEIEDEFYKVDDFLEESLRDLRDSVVKNKPLRRRG